MRTQFITRCLAFAAILAFATPAMLVMHADVAEASEPAGGHDDHGNASHGDAAHGDGEDGAHAEDHGHHGFSPLGDDDADGTVNLVDGDHELAGEFMGIKIPVLGKVGFHLINLLILLGVLVWFGRKPVGDFLKNRSVGITKELTDAAEVEANARKQFEELEARIAAFSSEADRMRDATARTAEVETKRIVDKAHTAAARIADSAQRAIRDEKARATRELRAEAVTLAMEVAEQRLRSELGAPDRQNLAEDFLTSLDAEGVT